MPQHATERWDIFCRVIDNHGDVGVCWRLARQLATEYGVRVRLWIDDLQALAHIWPAASGISGQLLNGIEVCHWPFGVDLPELEWLVADVVVEAFACELPASYVSAMAARTLPPRWFNLEYLSAEAWVEECHGLVSMHPATGLQKVFFFPGFTSGTGGLLCEASLSADRESFLAEPATRSQWLAQHSIRPAAGSILVSLFSYANTAMASLLEAWQQSAVPVTCVVPAGQSLDAINQMLSGPLNSGESLNLGNLTLVAIPFLQQTDYDRLLWSCEINFVRGEDSFVRAQWATTPLIWQIYPQSDDAHLFKLNAFLARYGAHLPATLSVPLQALTQAWNAGAHCGAAWENLLAQRHLWQGCGLDWVKHLHSLGNVAANMVHFHQKPL